MSTLQGTSVHYLGYPGEAPAYGEGGGPGVVYTYRGQGPPGGLGDTYGQGGQGSTYGGPGGTYGQGTVYVPAGRRGEVGKAE